MSASKRVTIREVARKAGVSVTTVSRVLSGNGTNHMRPETEARVLATIEALDYVPIRVAQRLRKQKTQVIAILLPDISNPFFSLLARGAGAAAFEKGFSTLVCDSNHSTEKESRYLDILLAEQVEGVVFIPVGQPNMKKVNRLLHWGIRIIVADRRVNGLPSVEADNKGGSYRLTDYLLQRGYRRIAYIAGPKGVSTAQDRLRGFQKAMDKANLDPVGIWYGNFTYESGYQYTREIYDSSDVDAIMAANDLMAIGTIQAVQDQGMKVPEDIAVTGFDSVPLAFLVRPTLTTVRIPAYEMGDYAVTMLLDSTANEKVANRTTKRIAGELIVGGSCRR